MKRENKKNKGFSLVELIIVIAIMVILGAIIAPQYFKHVQNAKKSSDIETASRISAAISAEYAEQQGKGTVTLTEGAWRPVSGISSITGTVGNSKVEKDSVFYYRITAATGDVEIGIAATTFDPDDDTMAPSHIISPMNTDKDNLWD